MENIVIRYLDHPKLDHPVFVEGLPGIGNVGKLAAEHLKDELSDFILREVTKLGVKEVYTLGGYGMGRMVTKPRVLGAATHPDLVKEMEKHGVVFSRGEPGGGSVGAGGRP